LSHATYVGSLILSLTKNATFAILELGDHIKDLILFLGDLSAVISTAPKSSTVKRANSIAIMEGKIALISTL
jgi:hypothetical protein